MKLYLSSYQIGNSPECLTQLVGVRKHVGLILNASDIYGEAKRPAYVAKFKQEFSVLGLSSEEIDLRKYFGRAKCLEADLERFGLLWASGGNAFTLRRAMYASGLDKILPEVLKDDKLVYGGFSAGACVVSPTLRGIDLVDEPKQIPAGYSPEVIWDGIGLVDFSIAPHFRSPHPESEAIEQVVDYFKRHKMPYRTLADGEAAVINEGKIEIVGRSGAF